MLRFKKILRTVIIDNNNLIKKISYNLINTFINIDKLLH